MVGGGNRKDDLVISNSNVFAALGTLRRKKKASSDKDSKSKSSSSKQQEEKEPEPQVFWSPAPVTAKSWADVDDEDDDDYYATTAPPQSVWSDAPGPDQQPPLPKESSTLVEESESEEEGLDEVDDDNEEEHEHESEVPVEKEPVIEKPAEVVAPKESERQLSKKEMKKKELAELEEMLAQFGYNQPDGEDASQGISEDKKVENPNEEVNKKENNAPVESKSAKKKKKKDKPPSPWKLPFIGNMHHLIGSLPHRALGKLAQKHGDVMHLQLGEISFIVLSSPRSAKEILKTHDLTVANRPEILVGKIVFYNRADIVCSPYGEYWRQMRKICTVELLSAKNVRSFGPIRQDEGLHLIASIQALVAAEEPINLTEEVYSYTISMVCRSAFGKVSKDDRNAFLQQIKVLMPLTSAFDVSDLFPSVKILHPLFSAKAKMMKIHHKMDRLLDNMIDQYVNNQARKTTATGESGYEDLLDVLLRVKESGVLQLPITNDNIKAIVIDIFLAGTETSSSVVEWAMSEMIRNPKVMVRAQTEVREAFMGEKKIEENDIQELKYLKLVIQETLRLHPPGPLLVPRECTEECEIDGYIIPSKTRVIVNAWALGRNPKYWDDPESFKPERFENISVDFMGNHFEYIPFGAGRRICPGISFGLSNICLPLALLLYHFDWKLPNSLNPNDLDMTEKVGMTVPRKNDLLLLATTYDPSLDMQC